jgi:hypothetical protein
MIVVEIGGKWNGKKLIGQEFRILAPEWSLQVVKHTVTMA